MSKRLQDYIATLKQANPGDVVKNDDLLYLRHAFKRPGAAELRNVADDRVLCQFTHEGILLRSHNAEPISCLPWQVILTLLRQPAQIGNPGITLQIVGAMLHIWKSGSEGKSPLVVPIQQIEG